MGTLTTFPERDCRARQQWERGRRGLGGSTRILPSVIAKRDNNSNAEEITLGKSASIRQVRVVRVPIVITHGSHARLDIYYLKLSAGGTRANRFLQKDKTPDIPREFFRPTSC